MSFKDLVENEINAVGSMQINEAKQMFTKGDKVRFTLKGIQKFHGKTPASMGYTSEQIKFSKLVSEIHDKKTVGTIERIFPGSTHVNVQFGDQLLGVDSFMLELAEDKLTEGKAETRELVLSIENNRQIHDRQIMPAVKIMKRKLEKDAFDPKAMLRVFVRIAEEGAKIYEKEYGTEGDTIFSLMDIQNAAKELMEQWIEEWKVNKLEDIK